MNTWKLEYNGQVTGVKNYGRESLLTLGNGFIGWRGANVLSNYDDDNYPGLYAAGLFNQTHTPLAGRDVVNEDMVNLPNPQVIKLTLDGVVISTNQIQNLTRSLDFQTGILTDNFIVKIDDNRQFTISVEKAVDPIDWHRFGFKMTITANFDGRISIESLIDIKVQNKNVQRYRDFDSQEFEIINKQGHVYYGKTITTDIEFAIGSKNRLNGEVVQCQFDVEFQKNQPFIIEKAIALATSNETNTSVVDFVQSELDQIDLQQIFNNSKKYWYTIWQDHDIEIEGDEAMQLLARMNVFHIHQSASSTANPHLDASVGSRGLTGEGYRGHIFWDELFVFPYYSANRPQTTQALLRYRTKRLDAALKNAQSENEFGAMYPWQSGLYGDEQSQLIHLNTVNNEWEPDNSRLQRHVSLAIAYNFWSYIKSTNDISVLQNGGLTTLIEIARFWINKAQLQDNGRYSFTGVMGPNEFHEAYPESETGGLKDNAYTNLMVVWFLNWLIDDLSKIQECTLEQELINKAKDMRNKMNLSINDDGIIEQFDGFFKLQQLNFKDYQEKYGDYHRIDRLLKAEGKSPDDYQVIKQADLLMIIYNLGYKHTQQLIEQLGYKLPDNWLEKNTEYYLERTTHGSTTSRPVFAGIFIDLARIGSNTHQEEAYEYLVDAIGSDYYDIQGGTTAEGIHLGVMGETLSVIQNGYAGVDLLHGQFVIDPHLPHQWQSLKFKQYYRGTWLTFNINHDNFTVESSQDFTIIYKDKEINLLANKPRDITLEDK